MAKFTIRQMLEPDIPDVKRIELDCGLSPWPAHDYHLELERNDSICLVCVTKTSEKQGAAVVGFLLSRVASQEAHVNNIAVEPGHRRQGAAASLILRLKEMCKDRSVSEIWLEVRKSNRPAAEFYENMGFETAYRRKNFYQNPPEDALVLKCHTRKPGRR